MQRDVERRSFVHPIELRAGRTDSGATLTGYAALFDVESQDLGGFREVLRKGCFDKVLASSPDVIARAEHDSALLLGRTSSGTCRLSTDASGLRYEVDLPATGPGRDVETLCKRGDLCGSSFAFRVEKDGQRWTQDERGVLREILEVAGLVDVAPVASPAYLETSVSARAVETAKEIAMEKKTLTEEALRTRALGRVFVGVEKREQSFEDRMNAIYAGLREILGSPWESDNAWWTIEATFADRVIIERFDGARQLWMYPMTFSADGVPTFGDPVKVEEQYVVVTDPVSERAKEEPPATPPAEPAASTPLETLAALNDLLAL